jgi:glycogen debranching enzyme
MSEATSANERYSIQAPSPRRDDRTRVLKHGETFAVFDHFGDIEQAGAGEEGLYHEGTRHLSRFRVLIQGRRPLLLSSTVRDDNCLLTVDLTNPDFKEGADLQLPKDTIHLFRSSFLFDGCCYSRFHLRNYALRDVALSWLVLFQADFADIFEVRGMSRARRGELLEPTIEAHSVCLRYRGLDRRVRETRIEFDRQPTKLLADQARFDVTLPPQGELEFDLTIRCGQGCSTPRYGFAEAFSRGADELQRSRAQDAHIYTSNEQFNDWLNRSVADLHMMVTQTPHGPYPYAGVPWFSTAFGRDGIITALEYLWIAPQMARGVLQFLAATQAKEVNPAIDAQPGKILHETRLGEMAELREIPFGKYYGSADATPLFVVLAHAYYARTADLQFIAS